MVTTFFLSFSFSLMITTFESSMHDICSMIPRIYLKLSPYPRLPARPAWQNLDYCCSRKGISIASHCDSITKSFSCLKVNKGSFYYSSISVKAKCPLILKISFKTR